jgi:hypothetical protein
VTVAAVIFMAVSWLLVLGLAAWSYGKVLKNRRHHDPDGIGPASPPVPGARERR